MWELHWKSLKLLLADNIENSSDFIFVSLIKVLAEPESKKNICGIISPLFATSSMLDCPIFYVI